MVRRLAKLLGWLLGGSMGLALIAYAILLVANLEDRSPIAEIAALKSLQNPASPIVSNAIVFNSLEPYDRSQHELIY